MRHFLLLLLTLASLLHAEDWEGESYATRNTLQHRWANAFFFDTHEFSGHETILDIGCGDGSLTQTLAGYTDAWVVGLDNSPDMIGYAQNQYGTDQITFVLADAAKSESYSELAGSCDLVVSFTCLHWVADHDTVLDGIMKDLVPGGECFLRFCSDGFDPIQYLADELAASPDWKAHFEGFVDPIVRFGVEAYRQLVLNHGFEIVRLEEVTCSDVLEEDELLWEHVKSWLPHYKFLEGESAERYLQELIGRYLAEFPRNRNGFLELPDSYLEVVLKKNS